jgi:hypothetical protein
MKAPTFTSACPGPMIRFRADPARSDGARYERAATRNRLRRQITRAVVTADAQVLQRELDWVLSRQSRYDKAPGGLGRTIRKR